MNCALDELVCVQLGRRPLIPVEVEMDRKSWSNVTNTPTFPTAPPISVYAESSSEIGVARTPVAGASVYTVEVASGTGWQSVATVTNADAYSMPELLPNDSYTFRVAAYNSSGATRSSGATTYTMT